MMPLSSALLNSRRRKKQCILRVCFSVVNPRNIDAENDDETLNINNHDIRKTEQMKLLVVYIDANLNFAGHISDLCTRASQKVRLRNLIPCNAKLMLYKTSILPYLTCCHSLWKVCKSSDSRQIERIQERALRAVYKSQTETYEELLTRAKMPTLYNRRLQDIAILMYKIKYRMAHRWVSELFTIKSTHQSLRNCDFELPRFDIVAYQDLSFGQRSVARSETWQASRHSRNIYAVWTLRAI